MKNFFISILIIPVVFMFSMNIYRRVNNTDELSTATFLNTISKIDYNFDSTAHYVRNFQSNWNNVVDDWAKPFDENFIIALAQFFTRTGTFFNFIGSSVFIVLGFFFDFIELFVSLAKVIFSLTGYNLGLGGA